MPWHEVSTMSLRRERKRCQREKGVRNLFHDPSLWARKIDPRVGTLRLAKWPVSGPDWKRCHWKRFLTPFCSFLLRREVGTA